jgi:hypothetical protein
MIICIVTIVTIPMVETLVGIVTDVSDVHIWKACEPNERFWFRVRVVVRW